MFLENLTSWRKATTKDRTSGKSRDRTTRSQRGMARSPWELVYMSLVTNIGCLLLLEQEEREGRSKSAVVWAACCSGARGWHGGCIESTGRLGLALWDVRGVSRNDPLTVGGLGDIMELQLNS